MSREQPNDEGNESDSSSRSLSPHTLATRGIGGGAVSEPSSSSANGAALGGALDEINSNLRADLEATRREVAEMRKASAARSAALAKLAEGDDDDRADEEELRLLNELLAEELSPDEDEAPKPSQQDKLQAAADRRNGVRAKTAAHGATRTNRASADSKPAASRSISSASSHHAAAAAASTAAIAAAVAAVSPSHSSSSSSSHSHSHAHPTAVKSRDVVSQYRAGQTAAQDWDQRQAQENAGEMEGTVKLKGDLGDECAICLDGLVSGNRVASLSCCHTFHAVCILEWLRKSSACPLCKQIVFHPLTQLAQRQNEIEQQQEQQAQADSNGQQRQADALSARMSALSIAGPAAAAPSPAASRAHRAQAAAALTAESRARIRQLRLDRQRAEEAFDALQAEHSATHSRAASKTTSANQRAASAAAKAQSSVHSQASPFSLTAQLQAASAASSSDSKRAPRIGSASSSSSHASARSSVGAGGLEPLSRPLSVSSQRLSSADSSHSERSSFAAPSSSSSAAPPPPSGSPARPSSNSSSIRAAAAATLSLAPTPLVSRTGKMATASAGKSRGTR